MRQALRTSQPWGALKIVEKHENRGNEAREYLKTTDLIL
jgi:hypothetical protein